MGAQKARKKKTVDRILSTAAEIFAESGFEGARMDEIANRAGVNKATIYYHIGDKKALYAQVLHDVFGDMAARMMARIENAPTPEEKLKTYVRSIGQAMKQHPYLPPIMMREIASGGANFPEIVAADAATIIGCVEKILMDGHLGGAFFKTNPLVLHFLVVGGFSFFLTSRPVRDRFSKLADKEVLLPEESNATYLSEELEKLILRAVKAS